MRFSLSHHFPYIVYFVILLNLFIDPMSLWVENNFIYFWRPIKGAAFFSIGC